MAVAERDLSEAEVVPELLPLGVGGFAVFVAGAMGSTLVHELAVVPDHLLRVDGDISLSRIQVEMA